MYNNNLTAQQPDIYALLSTDDTVEDIDESIDTDALVMDIFDSFTPSPAVRQMQRYDDHHPLSSNTSSIDSTFPTPTSTTSNTNEFGYNQGKTHNNFFFP
jgi:hypothetical protein